MYCSRCSAKVRPVVALDIDGTLADYHGHLLEFAADWLGYPPTGEDLYDGSEPFWAWFTQVFGIDRTTFRAIKLAFRQGGQKRLMQPYPGAAELPARLRERGVEVWLTTTRPWDRFDRIDPDTREWLRRHRIPYDALLFHEDKMAELGEQVGNRRVAAVLDDQHDILNEAYHRGWSTILRRIEWNRAVDWWTVAADLDEAYEMILLHVEEWERMNG